MKTELDDLKSLLFLLRFGRAVVDRQDNGHSQHGAGQFLYALLNDGLAIEIGSGEKIAVLVPGLEHCANHALNIRRELAVGSCLGSLFPALQQARQLEAESSKGKKNPPKGAQLHGQRDKPAATYGGGYCWGLLPLNVDGAKVEEVRRDTEPGGGVGAATPAICEPSPSRCKVGASSLPLGFRPCAT
jgi:hypothetical protein